MKRILAALLGLLMPLSAHAVREGTPVWYQPQRSASGATILGQRTQVIQVPRQPEIPQHTGVSGVFAGAMTPFGIGFVPQPDWLVSAGYTRRFANFEFKTGVNSILKWNDMIINEVGFRVDRNFQMRDVDLFAFGEYRRGTVASAGLSMDYDLEPYNWAQPDIGIFTISMGGTSGNTDYMRFGFGARNVWNVGGWQFSPSIGYEMFSHSLRMHDHIYPNPGIFLPLLTDKGDYVFGDQFGQFHNVPLGIAAPSDWFQVCLSPEDIWVAATDAAGNPIIQGDGTLGMIIYNPLWGNIPWGVGPGQCIIIGGDGPVVIPGVTHIYDTTWSGLFVGLEIEKQMTFTDRLRFYFQFGMPNYYSEGVWPHRTDWQQNPSFTDEGSTGAYSYQAEMEYIHQLSDRLQISLRADTSFFNVGNISGQLFVAGYQMYVIDPETGWYILDNNGFPLLQVVEPHTVKISDSLKYARWQSFGLSLSLRYSF